RHRHKRQEGARTKYTEHISKVGTCSHANVFEDIHEDLAAFDNAFFEHHQALLQQNYCGQFLSDIDAAIHGNTDIRHTQCGSVIDAIAHKSHNVLFLPQGSDDSLLVRR